MELFRNRENSQALFELSSNDIKLFEMDVVDEKSILDVSKNIHNPIDYLICNAGINNGYGSIFDQDHTHEKMLEVLNVNVIGSILTVKHFSKIFKQRCKNNFNFINHGSSKS